MQHHRVVCGWALATAIGIASGSTLAEGYSIFGGTVKKHTDGALALMAFTVVPDLTTSSLKIGRSNQMASSTELTSTQFAGGATLSKSIPLYLEGGAAYMRYDPKFVASNGTHTRAIPLKWNTFSASGGIGWDFPLNNNLVFRPIINVALGHVSSDLALLERFLEWKTGIELNFLDGGSLSAYGLGGSLMLDYELISTEHDIDIELRYTNIELKSFGKTPSIVRGEASAEAASLYARYRAPTGISLLDRPLRYVAEAANTVYLGDQRGILGITNMSSLGAGLELDTSAYDMFVTRIRLVARYSFGENVRGSSLSIAMSF